MDYLGVELESLYKECKECKEFKVCKIFKECKV